MSETESLRIQGQTTAPGLAIGTAFVYHETPHALSVPRAIGKHQVDIELNDIERALKIVRDDLQTSAHRIESVAGPKLAAIFDSHEVILGDSSLRTEIREEVEVALVGAAQAITRVFLRWEERFRCSSREMLRDRADDLLDIQRRLLREIAGVKTTILERMPKGRILVARRLFPSDTVALPGRGVLGIVLEFGSPGSHAALLARGLGIPMIVQVARACEMIPDGEEAVVDGFLSLVILHADRATGLQYKQAMRRAQEEYAQAKRSSRELIQTPEGKLITVMTNAGCGEDVLTGAENGADGVGLYRIEQFYLSRTTPPCVLDITRELRRTLAPLQTKPLTLRLLDLGADKPLAFVHFPSEDDPFLGRRGVRLLLRYPELLDVQLRAFLELSREYNLRILVPLVTMGWEMAKVRRRMQEIAAACGINKVPQLGAMVETPAAALCLGEIREHADFLSIGTNDLTQYTMAAGRENPLVNEYFVQGHPSVYRLIQIVLDEAGNTPVSICGELGGDLDSALKLLKMGICDFSVAPPAVPILKQSFRRHLEEMIG